MRRAWLCLLSLTCALSAPAADVAVVGNWTRTVNSADLEAGAGSDLASPIESATAIATLDITNTGGGSWRVNAAKSDIDWPPGINVAVRRSSTQSGVEGGETYLTLTEAEQEFVSGVGDRSIEIQLRVDGLTIGTPPAAYGLTITYTVQAL